MRDILSDLDRWLAELKPIALATVIETWGSSPRGVGAKMAFTADGKITGSVSGGCVESAVFEAGVEVLSTNQPRLLHFGVVNELAWEVGLACGGSIEIFVKPLDRETFQALRSVLKDERRAVLVTVIRGPAELLGRELLIREDGQITGTLGPKWDESVSYLAKETLSQGISRRFRLNEDIDVFIEVILPPSALIIVGGVHISVALSALAKTMGYRTILIDPRQAWGNSERFPHVDQLIQAWPEEAFRQIRVTQSTAIAMLTHDPKLDDLALQIALTSPAFYVGALGSKSTQATRRERLLEAGLSEAQLSRLHGPIGLEIGAKTPEEIALAIMAEIVDAYHRQGKNTKTLTQITAEHAENAEFNKFS